MLQQGQVTLRAMTVLIVNTVIGGMRTFSLWLRPKQSVAARPTQAVFMSRGSFCCPVVLQPPRHYRGLPEAGMCKQDTERWEGHWQAELPSDSVSPGLTAHLKVGEMSLELAKVSRANSKLQPPPAAVPHESSEVPSSCAQSQLA